MSEALADCVIARHRKRLHGRARRITIDLDPTDDPRTASNSSPFSIATTIATVICRWSAFSPSTTRRNSIWLPPCCARVMFPAPAVRSAFCAACFGVWIPRFPERSSRALGWGLRRRSSGVSRPPASCGICREPGLQCGVGSFGRAGHACRSPPVQEKWRDEHVYGEFRYKTKKTWKYERRILYKAEVTRHPNRDPKDNPRFVVTNMNRVPDGSTRRSTANAATWKIA